MYSNTKKLCYSEIVSSIVVLCVCIIQLLPAAYVFSADKSENSAKEQVNAQSGKKLLDSSLAGRWYPAETGRLEALLEGFFRKADINSAENPIALILPHAGYRYSGQTAAKGVKTINRKYKRVVILGPSHHSALRQILSLPDATHYKTPLGEVTLDTKFIDKLLNHPEFQRVPSVHRNEHSVQIELPLLQHRLGNFELVPIVTGYCSPQTIKKVSRILCNLVDEDTLVIASSDFVHYGARYGYVPFDDNIPENLEKLDMGAYKYIEQLDANKFLNYKRETGATICGYVPIAIVLSMLTEDSSTRLVEYTTSGELTGDYSNSVSYLSIVFTGNWKKGAEVEQNGDGAETNLSEKDKSYLLQLARKTITYAVNNRKVPTLKKLGLEDIPSAVKKTRAAFVTLRKNSHLRGCIGDITPQRPLYESVLINSINAAFRDRRFLPLEKDELESISIEISALTRPEPVSSPNDIEIGSDGIVLSKNNRRAVYLPHVATEQGWNLEQTLNHLSQKAGLPADAWKEGAEFQVFQAEIFGEDK